MEEIPERADGGAAVISHAAETEGIERLSGQQEHADANMIEGSHFSENSDDDDLSGDDMDDDIDSQDSREFSRDS